MGARLGKGVARAHTWRTATTLRLLGLGRRMAVAATAIEQKGRASFAVDPATLSPEQKNNLITRNLQVCRGLL